MAITKLLNLFRKDPVETHPLVARNREAFRKFDRDLPLHDYEMVVFDTELTGLNAKKDEIVAIGAVKIRNLQIQCAETFYALVKPAEQSHTPSTLIHRITPQQLNKAENLADILPKFLDFCGGAIHIGHYLRLDLDFFNAAAKKILGDEIRTPYLDTMRLAMTYNEAKHGHYYDHSNIHGAYTLTALGKEFGLPVFTAHNALQDSLQTAYLFLFLAKQMQGYGFRTMSDYLLAGRKWKILM